MQFSACITLSIDIRGIYGKYIQVKLLSCKIYLSLVRFHCVIMIFYTVFSVQLNINYIILLMTLGLQSKGYTRTNFQFKP